MELLGWILLSILSAILVIPLAWTTAAICRWFCRNLRFSDGTTVSFTGTGPEILGWMLLSVFLSVPGFMVHAFHTPTLLQLPWQIGGFFLGPLINLFILRWLVRNLRLSSGPPLDFDGSYAGYLGYQILIGLSVLTIIGWAWVMASFYNWMAEHTRGKGIAFHFNGTGWEILWRIVAAVLGSIPIVTIPWIWMWYTRWLVSCVTITRGAGGFDEN